MNIFFKNMISSCDGAFLVSVVMIFAGIITRVIYPKKPNMWVGYRTEKSMSSTQIWIKAQKISARFLLKGGCVSLILTFFIYLLLTYIGIDKYIINLVTLFNSLLILLLSHICVGNNLKTDN